MIDLAEFAVVDVETTGLFHQVDRIIEIAIIRVDSKGNLLDEYSTLVNPNRDLGPTHLHGISAKDVINAPVFEEITGDILARLSGAIFVAHNVHFDFKFLQSEVNRLGFNLPETPLLCTMQLALEADPSIANRSCETCCSHFGIPLDYAHSAYHDAKATAQLLTKCLDRIRKRGGKLLADIGIQSVPVERTDWPKVSPSGKSYTRKHSAIFRATEVSYIAKLVSSLPAKSEATSELQHYYALLDRVLEDRRISPDEADALFELAKELGMTKSQALDLHHQYITDLIHVALSDGVITESEQKDLDEVRSLLSIPEEEFQHLLSKARYESEKAGVDTGFVAPVQEEVSGKNICFTGALTSVIEGQQVSRSLAQRLAKEKGMIVNKTVTKKLDYLVAADPDSMSGKAKKARQYGIRIVAEPVFWRMLGVDVE
jgi:DNA polymerase-3 subunit epsilon